MRRHFLNIAFVALLPMWLVTGVRAQAPAQPKATDLRSVLLEQLHSTHDKAEWFVPLDTAVDGLTPDQVRWVPKAGGRGDMHSVGQLVAHLIYWNERSLAQLKGETPAKFSGNNEETFVGYDANTLTAAQWVALVARLNQVLTGYEQWVQTADNAKLAAAASTIAHVGTHNAYHTGEIVYVRKLQGSWNPDKGVK
jgi:DinB superfamily